jgi:hypothetical protein
MDGKAHCAFVRVLHQSLDALPVVNADDASIPSPSHRCLVLPFSLPFGIDTCSNTPSTKAPGGASHIRIVWSSEHDANILSFFGFHATELTLPSPWPERTSSKLAVSRCQTYTFASGRAKSQGDHGTWHESLPSLPLTIKLPSVPPKQLRMTCRPCFCPLYLRTI